MILRLILYSFLLFNTLCGYDSIELLNPNITLQKSGYFKTSKDLTPLQAYEIAKESLNEMPKQAKSFGFDNNTYWFIFEITTTQNDSNFFLDVKDPLVQSCILYVFQDNQLISSEKSGYMTPLKNRPINQFPIRFTLTNNTLKTTYLIKTVSQFPIYASYAFGEQHELDNVFNPIYIIFILSCGIFLTMFFYNIFLYFVIKDKAYIFYCLYIFGYSMITLLAQGYITLVSDSLVIYTPLLLALFLQIKFIGLVFFTIYFLNLTKTFVLLEKNIRYLLYANIIASLTVPFATEVQILSIIFMNALYITLIYAGFKSYFSGFKPALYYLIATGIALVSSIAYSFMNQGIFFSFNIWTINLMTFGLIWDMILLSLALAYRIKVLQEENIKKEQLLMIKSRQNSISELSGNIAHQWRHPLSELGAIMANLEAKLKYSAISDQEILKSIFISSKILKNLSETVNTFQGFFQHKKDDTLFNVDNELKNIIDFIKDSMDNNNIKITYLYDKEAFLKGNSNEFSQVILNIILNAKDMLIEKNIQDPLILINLQRYEYGFKIIINDNGGGIKIKPIESIFESYVTDKQNGTGIGLFIAKTIITQKFNGEIEAYNDKDGAIFEIKFNTKDSISCGFDT